MNYAIFKFTTQRKKLQETIISHVYNVIVKNEHDDALVTIDKNLIVSDRNDEQLNQKLDELRKELIIERSIKRKTDKNFNPDLFDALIIAPCDENGNWNISPYEADCAKKLDKK